MNKRIILYLILAIISMFLIFDFSSKNTNSSNGMSKRLINTSVEVVEKITNKDLDNDKIVNKLNYPVRKVAHFTIYLILGFFIYNSLLLTNIKYKELITIVLGFIYSVSDEIHQLYVSGRTGQVIDVIIDTIGVIAIVVILKYINYKKVYSKSNK